MDPLQTYKWYLNGRFDLYYNINIVVIAGFWLICNILKTKKKQLTYYPSSFAGSLARAARLTLDLEIVTSC